MNGPAQLASQLRDIHLPAPPSWWPPAPGWWLIAGLVLTAGLWILMRRPAWKREALARLRIAQQSYARHGESARLLADLSELLRACAVLLEGRRKVAGLVGSPWLECLRELGGGTCPAPEEALIQGPYQRQVELDARAFCRSVAVWIRGARKPRRHGS